MGSTAIPAFLVGGGVVRRYYGLSTNGSDLDLAVDAAHIEDATELLVTSGYEVVPRVDVEEDDTGIEHPLRGHRSPSALVRLCFGRSGLNLWTEWIDLIPVEPRDGSLDLGVRDLLGRFDVRITRCSLPAAITVYGPMISANVRGNVRTYSPEVYDDLLHRRVVMEDVPWQRPHREAKYRRLLGLGPRSDGRVLPLILPPHEVQARRKAGQMEYPVGFRALTLEEIQQVRAFPKP